MVQAEGERVEAQLRAADERATSPYYAEGGLFANGRPGVEMKESDEERRVREEELRQFIEASEEARRRLGQRTSASELTREQLRESLYGARGR